jgi:hypothetical protein
MERRRATSDCRSGAWQSQVKAKEEAKRQTASRMGGPLKGSKRTSYWNVEPVCSSATTEPAETAKSARSEEATFMAC